VTSIAHGTPKLPILTPLKKMGEVSTAVSNVHFVTTQRVVQQRSAKVLHGLKWIEQEAGSVIVKAFI
jgi:hypothetical protein